MSTTPRRAALPALAGILVLLAGRPASASWLSENLERLYGSYVKVMLEAQVPLEKDALLNDMVRDMFGELVEAGGRPNLEHRIRILDTDMVNAMAAPGGYVWVTKGMLRFVDTPDELAAVLGHELGHVTYRHGWENLKRDFAVDMLLNALQATQFADFTGWASVLYYFKALHYSREDELEADRAGATFSQLAGWDNLRMSEFFTRLAKEDGHQSKFDIFFSTHPSHEQRLEQLSTLPEFAITDPAVLVRIGDNYAARYLFNQAAESYQAALKLDPDHADAHARLASVYGFLGMDDRARESLARARSLSGGALPVATRDELVAGIVDALAAASQNRAPTPAAGGLDVSAALAALDRADENLREAESLLEHHARTIEKQRKDLDTTLDHAVDFINERIAGAPSSVRGWQTLAAAADAVSWVTESAVASDEVADISHRVVEEHRATQNLLRRVITDPELLARAPVSVSLALAAPEATAAATVEMVDALGQARQSLEEAQAAALSIGANTAALRRALYTGAGYEEAIALFSRHSVNVRGAVRSAERAQKTGSRAAVRSAEAEIALDLALSGAVADLVTEATLARLLRADTRVFAQARQATSNFGEIIMICAASRMLKTDVSEIVHRLNGEKSVVDGLANLGVDMDNLHIVMHLAATTLRHERNAALRLRGLDRVLDSTTVAAAP